MVALIIGINEYKPAFRSLTGAVSDAYEMKHYLEEFLYVPESHIKILTDADATRDAIENGLRSLEDITAPGWKKGDAILIYFAGHGMEAIGPDDWATGNTDGMIQFIVSADFDPEPVGGEGFHSLPDFTLAAYLERIASQSGDNIVRQFTVAACWYLLISSDRP